MKIKVKVTPGARRETIAGDGESLMKISVKEPAKGNQANGRVRELLALHFHVDVKKVRFVSGMRGKTKTFEVIQ